MYIYIYIIGQWLKNEIKFHVKYFTIFSLLTTLSTDMKLSFIFLPLFN